MAEFELIEHSYVKRGMWRELDPPDFSVWCELADLARRKNEGEEVELPPRAELARTCNVGIHQVARSLRRLQKAGYVRVHNLDQKKGSPRCRWRAVIWTLRPPEKSIGELIEMGQKDPSMRDDIIHSRSDSFSSPELRALVERVPHIDSRGVRLRDIPPKQLLSLANNAPAEELEIALLVLLDYRPGEHYAKRVQSIRKLWRSLFDKEQGQVTQETRERFKGIHAVSAHGTTFEESVKRERDAALQKLGRYEWIYRGHLSSKLLTYLLDHDFLLFHKEDKKLVRLRDEAIMEVGDAGVPEFHHVSPDERSRSEPGKLIDQLARSKAIK